MSKVTGILHGWLTVGVKGKSVSHILDLVRLRLKVKIWRKTCPNLDLNLELPALITEKALFDLLCMLDSVSDRCPLGDLFQFSCVKLRSHEQIGLICNKDDLGVKTLIKMTLYTDKCICSGNNIWCVSVILVYTLENIICQSDLGKDLFANFIWQSLCPV